MPHDRGVIPVLEVGAIVKGLRQHLDGTHDYALHCPRAAPTVGVVACTCHHRFKTFSQHRRYCQLPVSGRRMQRFYSLDLVLISCQLFLAVLLEASMLPGPIGCAHIVVVWLLQMKCT
jgi:hypothetical protein